MLAVFAWGIIPTHTLHEVFATHEDTSHEVCNRLHEESGVHLEAPHVHCEILNTTTPVYDSPEFLAYTHIEAVCITEINTLYSSEYFHQTYLHIPARGPPSLA